ncbi:hypothetical protein MAPG_10806 [Magnaporthiopsis poae ATCC 64411]|uniref:Uncharacterized protein n=1 Tax=Magnaporthiopsis poae (strain ATCC 64411 / 73-15) TaxID=644358 RepID=A0A0C4EDK4_MAGP6|nr:hypothetical protein MAPG_10806 [Magnaporthiopsis poae ATCC 64411]
MADGHRPQTTDHRPQLQVSDMSVAEPLGRPPHDHRRCCCCCCCTIPICSAAAHNARLAFSSIRCCKRPTVSVKRGTRAGFTGRRDFPAAVIMTYRCCKHPPGAYRPRGHLHTHHSPLQAPDISVMDYIGRRGVQATLPLYAAAASTRHISNGGFTDRRNFKLPSPSRITAASARHIGGRVSRSPLLPFAHQPPPQAPDILAMDHIGSRNFQLPSPSHVAAASTRAISNGAHCHVDQKENADQWRATDFVREVIVIILFFGGHRFYLRTLVTAAKHPIYQ